MRDIDPALLALISGTQFVKSDLFTFSLANGSDLQFTDLDVPVTTDDARVFLANSIVLERSKIKNATGLEVNELEITAYAKTSVTIGGVPFLQFCQQGGLDGTWVILERGFAQDADSLGNVKTVTLFVGRVSTCDVGRTKATIVVKAWTELLNANWPLNVYQPGCIWTLFGPGCTLLKSNFAVNSAVNAGSNKLTINASLAQPNGWFELGTITFTSGANINQRRAVRRYSTGVVGLAFPLPNTPAPGDTFSIYPGCDKLEQTCDTKFNNKNNYRGYRFIPAVEMAQ